MFMSGATASVVIAAYNAMPYLTQCIASVAEQRIGRDRLEVIVVDDGPTDGTAAELERLKGRYVSDLAGSSRDARQCGGRG
ncbi:glycosyltransferase [Streptomyces tricolor]|uniref:glycosyltransferase n=1 Tax=Streptomyces tricolor TaxID=68277 RepID=UPI0036F0E345